MNTLTWHPAAWAMATLWLQVMDFSALGAQAIAQVERAQRAARDQLVAAMNQRPKLSLRLELEGPKIAVPVPATDGQGDTTRLACVHVKFLDSCKSRIGSTHNCI